MPCMLLSQATRYSQRKNVAQVASLRLAINIPTLRFRNTSFRAPGACISNKRIMHCVRGISCRFSRVRRYLSTAASRSSSWAARAPMRPSCPARSPRCFERRARACKRCGELAAPSKFDRNVAVVASPLLAASSNSCPAVLMPANSRKHFDSRNLVLKVSCVFTKCSSKCSGALSLNAKGFVAPLFGVEASRLDFCGEAAILCKAIEVHIAA